MKVQVRIKGNNSEKQNEQKTYTLKANFHWKLLDCVKNKINTIHVVRELPETISMDFDIAAYWYPTIEEDGGVAAYLTFDNRLWIVIGDNKLYANEDSSHIFSGFSNCQSIDGLELINTKNVKTFNSAFSLCGENARVSSIKGIDKWDVSNVNDMIILPMICLILSMVYGMRNGIGIWYVAAVAVLFAPSIFLFYNSSAAAYIIGYAGIACACIGTSIGSVFKRIAKKQTKEIKNCHHNN